MLLPVANHARGSMIGESGESSCTVPVTSRVEEFATQNGQFGLARRRPSTVRSPSVSIRQAVIV
jgi:hypothetical protein